MNNLIKITAVLALVILSGCVGSLNIPTDIDADLDNALGAGSSSEDESDDDSSDEDESDNDSSSGGNTITKNTVVNINNINNGNINFGIDSGGDSGSDSSDSVSNENPNTLIIPRAGFTQLESLLAQVDSRENFISSVTYNYNTAKITSRNPQNVFITDGDNQFIADIAGKEYIFSNISDNNKDSVNNGAGDFLVRRQHYADGALNQNTPNDYILFQYGVYDDITNINSSGYVVVGIQTPQGSIPTTASATYTGRIASLVFYDGDSETFFLLGGRIDMDVHFGQRTISGEISNIAEYIDDIAIPASSVIELNQTTFRADGSYDGTLTVYKNFADPLNISTYVGGYSGGTYGPNASSLAGVFDFTGQTLNGQPYAATGGFYADK